MWARGVHCIPYDIINDRCWQDFTSARGFAMSLLCTLRMDASAGALAAIVCSSWCRMCIATSGRTTLNPLGNQHIGSIAAGNLMASRLAILLLILDAAGHWWVLEQPAGSKLIDHPRLQQVLVTSKVYFHKTAMWRFDGSTAKPTWLYSNFPFITEVDRYATCHEKPKFSKRLVNHHTNASGKRCYSGNKSLKGSQEYPLAFGRAMARVYETHTAAITARARAQRARALHDAQTRSVQELRSLMETKFPSGKQGWDDAELDEVMAFLRNEGRD